MANINIEPEKLNELTDKIKSVMNGEVIESVKQVAVAIQPDLDKCPPAQKLHECGKVYQGQFNGFTEAIKTYLGELSKYVDISEYMKKLSVGEVGNRDTEFTSNQVDAAAVMQ